MPESLKKANLDHWDSKDSFTQDELAYLLLDLEPQNEGSHPVIVEKTIHIFQHARFIFGGINSKYNKYLRRDIRNWASRCLILDLIPFLQNREERNILNGLAQGFGLNHDDEKVSIHDGAALKIINQIPVNFSEEEVREVSDFTFSDGRIVDPGYIQTDNPNIYKHITRIGRKNPFIQSSTRKIDSSIKVSKTDDEAQEGTKGVTVTLPYVTKGLEMIFELMWKHWSNYDPSQKFNYNGYLLEITDKLGDKLENKVEPSHRAKTIGSLLKPANYSGRGGPFKIKS